MRYHLLLLLLTLGYGWPHMVRGQIVTRLLGGEACPGPLVVQVEVEGLSEVASMSLRFNYNTSALGFDSITAVHPVLSSGVWVSNAVGGMVILSWFGLSPVAIPAGTLAEVCFRFTGIGSLLEWDTLTPGYCTYTNTQGQILPARFVNGEISTTFVQPHPVHPANWSGFHPGMVSMAWTPSGCGAEYTLAVATDREFTQAVSETSGLEYPFCILAGLSAGQTYFWRVQACLDTLCTPWSDVWTFSTYPTAGMEEPAVTAGLRLSPNPASDVLRIHLPPGFQAETIQVFDGTGQMVMTGSGGPYPVSPEIMTAPLRPGTYLLRITSSETVLVARFIRQ